MSLQLPFNFDPGALTVAPSPFLEARETSALAAVANVPHRSRQNEQVLALITAAGAAGMSDAEIQQATGLTRQTICLRRHDLRAFLTPATRRAVSPFGRPMCTWRRKTAAEMEAGS
jgi:hypothetical protein